MTERDHFGHKPIRLGMVGGGQGGMIGATHRYAARLDGGFTLVAGALSSDAERAKASAQELGIAPERAYASFAEMAEKEVARPDGIEAVTIVTPNHMHLPAAKAFLEKGINVICDKPLTASLADAEELAALAKASGSLFILTHNYSAYPMIREAREMVRSGALGAIRIVQAEYAQDWLTEPLEASGHKQAGWRTDPARAGGGAIGDIGTHAYQLAAFVTGQLPSELSAELSSFVPGRRVDDNAHITLRYASGARGSLWISQVAPGQLNGLRLRLYGDKGGLEWAQEYAEDLWHAPFGEPRRLIRRGGPGTGAASAAGSRTPGGHPAGYLEGFANLYSEAATLIRAHAAGEDVSTLLPGIDDGLAGVKFVDACQRSSANNAGWVSLG